ncbi:hypothetical protein IJG04_01645 [Candidatus Saccharibacteria bacterium]|nr:hypothetical protein [Candidatus Saccharibacteria bacterium]
MNENPEGTPNPLNPNPATVAKASSSPAGVAPTPEVGASTAVRPAQPSPAQPAVPQSSPAQPTVAPARPAPTGLSMDFMQAPRQGAGRVGRPMGATPSAGARPTAPVSPVAGTASASGVPRPVDISTPSADDAIAAIMAESTTANPADDLVAKDSIVEPKKGKKSKKKVAIIIGIIFIVLALICGAAAVAIMLLNNNSGRVDSAINKWLTNEEPNNLSANGTILITDDSDTATFSSLLIDIDTKNDRLSSSSTTSAKITMTLPDEQEMSFDVDSIQVNGGDLFLKLSNWEASKTEALLETENTVDCTDEGCTEATAEVTDVAEIAETTPQEEPVIEDCMIDGNEDNCAPVGPSPIVEPAPISENETLSILTSLFDSLGNGWIRIPLGEATTEDESTVVASEDSLTCLNTTLTAISQNRNSIAEFYRQNSFIKSSTDNIKISAKTNNPIYSLTFDSEKLSGFSSAIDNASFANEIFACADTYGFNTEVDDIFASAPTVYVEVNDNNDFTRVYLDGALAGSSISVNVDLALSYPTTIQVSEPAEYTDITTLLTDVLTGYYADVVTTDDGTEETVIIEDDYSDTITNDGIIEEEYLEEEITE